MTDLEAQNLFKLCLDSWHTETLKWYMIVTVAANFIVILLCRANVLRVTEVKWGKDEDLSKSQIWEGLLDYDKEFSFHVQCSRQLLMDICKNSHWIWFTFLKDHCGYCMVKTLCLMSDKRNQVTTNSQKGQYLSNQK